MNRTAKKDKEKSGVIAALRRATVRARDVAARTQTPVVIYSEGHVTEEHADISDCGDLSRRAAGRRDQHVAEEPGTYGEDETL